MNFRNAGYVLYVSGEHDTGSVEGQRFAPVSIFLDKIEILNKIREENEVSFWLEIVPTIYVQDTNPVLAPTPDIIDFCHATRTEMDIDMYLFEEDDE